MANILVVHLSDIHFVCEADPVFGRAEKIAGAVFGSFSQVELVVLAVTGDIAQSGLQSQYLVASAFLKSISESIKQQFNVPVEIAVVPGNHDCDHGDATSEVRKTLLQGIRVGGSIKVSDAVLQQACSVQNNFNSFRDAIQITKAIQHTPLWSSISIQLHSKKILFNCVNTAWCSELDFGLGRHEFPVDQHRNIAASAADFRFTLLHHPFHWINNSRYKDFERLIRQSADVVFTGHEHTGSSGIKTDTNSKSSTHFYEGAVLQDRDNPKNSGFMVCLVDTDSRNILEKGFDWDGQKYSCVNGVIPSPVSIAQPKKVERPFTDAWIQQLRDLGAAITHPAKSEVFLHDLYIFPEFERDFAEDEDLMIRFSGIKLLEDLTHKPLHALFTGDGSSGRTAWLKTAAQYCYDNGLFPVLIRGEELASSSSNDIDALIEKAISHQYGNAAVEHINQKTKNQKVLLVDDIDRFKFPDRYFNRVIEGFLQKFDTVMLTVAESFMMQVALEHETYSAISSFERFTFPELGVKSRYELVKRWYDLAPITSRGEDKKRLSQIQSADKAISRLMGRGLVPAYPIYLLVLLQGFEAGQAGELENSALGDYYQYLITHALLKRINKDEVNSFLDYCDNFAWYLSRLRKHRVDEAELLNFHLAFVKRMEVKIKFEDRKRALLDAKLWVEDTKGVGFRYPYARYFFLGRFIAREMSGDQEVAAVLTDAAKSLHVRDNGNLVSFVAFHSKNDGRVMGLLLDAVESRFVGIATLRMDSDVDPVNRLVSNPPRLLYAVETKEEARHSILEKEERVLDNATAAGDVEAIKSQEGSTTTEALQLMADLNAIFKAIEILGGVLKLSATTTTGDQKQQILNTIFQGGLRTISKLLFSFTQEPEALAGEVAELLDKKGNIAEDKSKEYATRAIFSFFGWIIYWLVRRLGSSVGATVLLPAIDRYVEENTTPAIALLGISCLLETPAEIPNDKLQKLNKDFEGKALARYVLRQLAFTRLHMYRTDVAERQRLCQEFGIEMDIQRAVEYQTRDTKRIKRPKSQNKKSKNRRRR